MVIFVLKIICFDVIFYFVNIGIGVDICWFRVGIVFVFYVCCFIGVIIVGCSSGVYFVFGYDGVKCWFMVVI